MEENNFKPEGYQPQQTINQQYNNQFGQRTLPNSVGILVMGILSIVFCFCYGFIGLVLGIIAIALSVKANALYMANPGNYTLASYNNMKAGKICAIIGTILSSLVIIYIIAAIFFIGATMSTLPWTELLNKH